MSLYVSASVWSHVPLPESVCPAACEVVFVCRHDSQSLRQEKICANLSCVSRRWDYTRSEQTVVHDHAGHCITRDDAHTLDVLKFVSLFFFHPPALTWVGLA